MARYIGSQGIYQNLLRQLYSILDDQYTGHADLHRPRQRTRVANCSGGSICIHVVLTLRYPAVLTCLVRSLESIALTMYVN